MSMSNIELQGGFGYFLGVVGVMFGFFVSIFWMWVGWRAMRAHERVADALEGPATLPPRSS
ncbi:MAG: hypothetical protein EPO68_11865 [Planctomycetota bacterium]|nr:MAG: hypothetical protein EPO68_11865 [Planctomycetota bacterium]